MCGFALQLLSLHHQLLSGACFDDANNICFDSLTNNYFYLRLLSAIDKFL